MNIDENIIKIVSKNSHELFHSNLWAWLIEKEHRIATVFFDDIDYKNIDHVDRESKNRDITIVMKSGDLYVIENKFKSVPDENQLNEYRSKTEEENPNKGNKYLLTYLMEPDFDTISIGWDKISYIKISKKLKQKIGKIKDNPVINKYNNLLIEYCDYIKYIYNEIKNEPYFTNNKYDLDLPTKYDNDSVYKKIKGTLLKEYVKNQKGYKQLEKAIENKGYKLVGSVGFFRGSFLVDFKILKMPDNRKKDTNAIIIQIQEYSYKYLIVVHEEKSFNYLCNLLDNEFIVSGFKKGDNIHGKETRQTKKYGNYGYHKYQYWNIEKGMSFDELSKQIIKDLSIVVKHLDNKKVKKFLDKEYNKKDIKY